MIVKNTKLTIYNNSELPLKVTSENLDQLYRNEFNVKRQTSIELKPGKYNFAFFYQSAELELTSNMQDNLHIALIHSQSNADHLGKLIEIENAEQPIIITCNNMN